MKVTADTNVLLRAILDDHPSQSDTAKAALAEADLIVVTTPTLCELVWVLRQAYERSGHDIAALLEELTSIPAVIVNDATVQAGLAAIRAGGDFADGVIAFEGAQAGGATFLTFDRKAAALVKKLGREAALLA